MYGIRHFKKLDDVKKQTHKQLALRVFKYQKMLYNYDRWLEFKKEDINNLNDENDKLKSHVNSSRDYINNVEMILRGIVRKIHKQEPVTMLEIKSNLEYILSLSKE